MSCFQAEQLTLAKEGVRPPLKVSASRNPRLLRLLLQDRSQTLANEAVQVLEHVTFRHVLEVLEPARKCRVHVLNRAFDAVTLFATRLFPDRRLQLFRLFARNDFPAASTTQLPSDTGRRVTTLKRAYTSLTRQPHTRTSRTRKSSDEQRAAFQILSG